MNIKEAAERINREEPIFLQRAKRKGFVCPVCDNGTGKDGDGISLDKDGIHSKCFKCGFYGDNLELIGEAYKLPDFVDRVKKGCEIYGLHLDEEDGETQQPTGNPTGTPTAVETATEDNRQEAGQNEAEPPQEDYTQQLKQWHENMKDPDNLGLQYLQDRGISEEVINRFNVGYCPAWKHPSVPTAPATPRVIVPTSKYSYLARDIRGTVPEGQERYTKMKAGKVHFLGIENVVESPTAVILVEGEIDALSVYEAGGVAVALGSVAYIEKFFAALDAVAGKRHNYKKPFVIALDNDPAGEAATAKLKDGLQQRQAQVFECNPCGDYKDANEALTASRDRFIWDIRGISTSPAAWLKRQKNDSVKTLQGFIDSIAVNTPAISTGFDNLDKLLEGGLREGLYTLIARTGAGKTTFVNQLGDNIAQNGGTVLYYNLEMSTAELMAKSISRLTLINSLNGHEGTPKQLWEITDKSRYDTITDGNGRVLQWGYTEADKQLIELSIQDYGEYVRNLHFYETIGYIDTDEIRQDIAFEKYMTGKPPVVIVDYLQMLALGVGLNSKTKGLTEYTAINKAILDLKQMSRDYHTPIIAISSSNREGTKSGKAVSLENALGSGSIDYTADVSLILEYVDAETDGVDLDDIDTRDTREMYIKLEKNRNGRRGTKDYLTYTPAYNYFQEVGSETETAEDWDTSITF